MDIKQTYTVGGHSFCIIMQENSSVWDKMTTCYAPFADSDDKESLFTLTVCDEHQNMGDTTALYIDPNPNPTEAKIDVYHTESGYLFELTPHLGGEQHSFLQLSNDLRTASLLLGGSEDDRFCGVNTALMLCYLLATVRMNTTLMHASAVINKGEGYLFLGRSGTGKSTHRKLWQKHIPDTMLLNDDHPIVRINAHGQAIVYGSPWSGKTPCYRNESALLSGIVRIKQATHNHIRRLSPVESYASLMSSCSGMSWDELLADGKDETLQKIIATTPCYTLECLPDEAAAELCAQTIKKEQVCTA